MKVIRLSRPQGHSVAEKIMSMKNSNNTIGNRTFRLLAQCLNQVRHRVPRQVDGHNKILHENKHYFFPPEDCRGNVIHTRSKAVSAGLLFAARPGSSDKVGAISAFLH
jgi:hypothetical protein